MDASDSQAAAASARGSSAAVNTLLKRTLTAAAHRARRQAQRVRNDRVLLALTLLLGAGLLMRVWLMLVWRPAFVGYSDSGIYFQDSIDSLWTDPIRTAGYSMFLRALHAITPHLLLVTLVQHGLGLIAVVVVFASVRRCGGPRWLGLLPAAVVALDGDYLFLEHAALSDSLFIFLLICTLYCAIRAKQGAHAWAAAAGLLVGLGVWDRGAGTVMAPVIPLWLLFSSGRPTGRTTASAALALLATVGIVGVYVGWRHAASNMPGLLTSNNAYNFYSRVAPWANCDDFTPPPGTRGLCESTPVSKRTLAVAGEAYVYSERSPAYKLFGPAYEISDVPHAMQLLTSWSEAAIEGQPLEYLHAVWRDTVRLFSSSARSWGDSSASQIMSTLAHGLNHNNTNGYVESWEHILYPDEGRPAHGDLAPLETWERLTRIEGAAMAILLGLCLAGPWLLRVRRRPRAGGDARSGMILFGATALAMLFFPILTKGYDYRFVIPAFAPLTAAAALSAWGFAQRIRVRVAATWAHPAATSRPGLLGRAGLANRSGDRNGQALAPVLRDERERVGALDDRPAQHR